MKRRDFLLAATAAAAAPRWIRAGHAPGHTAACGPGYASPEEAQKAPHEQLLYTVALYTGSPIQKPDYLATIDVDPQSASFGQVIHRLEMPYVGDELHHFGWNACSSCHADATKSRRFLIIPGLQSSRIYIVDAENPRAPKLHKVIEPEEIRRAVNLSAPHTVHCLAGGQIMISMLGDGEGRAPGGFLLLDESFGIAGRWEREAAGMQFNYDYWYQPRHNVMVSTEWAAPTTYRPGFNPAEVEAGKYGQRLHFWDWKERKLTQTIDLGAKGLIPLEVRFQHRPDSVHGFVGAALSSVVWHFYRGESAWQAEPVITVDSIEQEGWPFPVPGLITDLVLSMDDRWLYFSNWLHGDIRQYDVSDPAHPRLAGQLWLGGVLGKAPRLGELPVTGGPQMLQLSLDGRRLYVTNSLLSSWDNQFYPEMNARGSFLAGIDCDTEQGGLSLNPRLVVDFSQEPHGPARAHEMRYPGGDCTSDIWT